MTAQHIVVTTDLSEESQRAFAPVAYLAGKLGARVTLLYVVHNQIQILPPEGVDIPAMRMDPEEAAAAARESLEEFRGRLSAAAEVDVDTVVGADVADAIVERAAEKGADLIAMATHGHSGIKRLLLGSVAEQVVRRSSIPVILYPAAAE